MSTWLNSGWPQPSKKSSNAVSKQQNTVKKIFKKKNYYKLFQQNYLNPPNFGLNTATTHDAFARQLGHQKDDFQHLKEDLNADKTT